MQTIDALPDEVLYLVLESLSAIDLVRLGSMCHRLHAITQDDQLWRRLYRAAFDCSAPPPEHAEHARFGKNVRWLYVLAILSMAGAKRRTLWMPSSGRIVGRITSTDGKTVMTGEFVPSEITADGRSTLVLDGYGASVVTVTTPAQGMDKPASTSQAITEGMWRNGKLVGPGRTEWDAATIWFERADNGLAKGEGRALYRNSGDTYTGSFSSGKRHGFGTYVFGKTNEYKMGEWVDDAMTGRGIVSKMFNGDGPYSGQLEKGVSARFGILRLADGSLREAMRSWTSANMHYSILRCPRPALDVDSQKKDDPDRRNTPDGAGADPRRGRTLVSARSINGDCTSVEGTSVPQETTGSTIVARVFDDGLVSVQCQGAVRSEYPDGTVVITGPMRNGDCAAIRLLAVSETFADPRVAGLRMTMLDFVNDGSNIKSAMALADPSSLRAHLFMRYLGLPQCHLDSAHARCLVDVNRRFGYGTLGDIHEGESRARIECMRAYEHWPFGQAFADATGQKMVKCFLTGAGHLLEATACTFAQNGCLYCTKTLQKCWLARPWGAHDPETGVAITEHTLGWKAWMDNVSPRYLARVVADVLTHTIPKRSELTADAIDDLVRYRVFSLAMCPGKILTRRGFGLLLARCQKHDTLPDGCCPRGDGAESHNVAPEDGAAVGGDESNDGGDAESRSENTAGTMAESETNSIGPLGRLIRLADNACTYDTARESSHRAVRSFDGLVLSNTEVRHPLWEPRGPWTNGVPHPLIETPEMDTTMDVHELAYTVGGGKNASTAMISAQTVCTRYWDSHGIIHMPLVTPSFVGAQLTDVFFMGHTFEGASFAGARLLRCAFVGCTFRDCVFVDATLTQCAFYECRVPRITGYSKSPTVDMARVQIAIDQYGTL